MKHYKTIILFTLKAIGIYGICIVVLFAFADTGYSSFFRGLGNVLFSSRWNNVSIQFVPQAVAGTLTAGHTTRNTSIRLNNRDYHYADGRPVLGEIGTNSHLQGYLPTAMIIALFAAMPLGWWKRLKLLGVGIIAIHGFISVLLWLVIVSYAETNGIGWYRFADGMKEFLAELVSIILMNQIGISFMVPLLLWVCIIALAGEFHLLLPKD